MKRKFTARYISHLQRVDVKIEPPVGKTSGFSISMIGPVTAGLLLMIIEQANGGESKPKGQTDETIPSGS